MLRYGQQMLLAVLIAIILPSAFAEKIHKYPTINPPKSVDEKAAARGEYLVKASDCLACHTTDGGQSFAGGLGLATPFGTYYSPNITPDVETGIGSWTEAQFVRALKWGMGPNAKMYFPVFPYIYYNKFTDQEAQDIWAYLQSIPKVKLENKPIDAPFIFRFRPANIGWNLLFFYPYADPYRPDKTKSDAWNRGRFLVKGPAHCDMCHTSINFLGGLKREESLLGSDVSGFYAPNLTPITLSNFSLEEVYRVFAHDELPGGGKVQGPMLEANQNSFQYLTEEDLYAISTYVKALEPRVAPKKSSANPIAGVDPKVLDHYQTFCSGCHDMGSAGAPKFGNGAAWAGPIALGKETLYKNATNGIGGMPAKGLCAACTEEDIHALVDYMVLAASDKPSGPKKPTGPAPIKPSLALGEKIYQENCSTCHDNGVGGAPKIGDIPAWKPRIDQGMESLVTYAIDNYRTIPPSAICPTCNDTDLIAAVKYMVQLSQKGNDYALW